MSTSFFSVVIEHDVEAVWSAVRDFNGLATWFDTAVTESHLEDGLDGATVGAIRSFQLGEARIREKLLSLSDRDRSYSYSFCEPAPFPVDSYVATLSVTPVTATNQTLVQWWATFDCAADEREHWAQFFAAEVFAPALENLRSHLG